MTKQYLMRLHCQIVISNNWAMVIRMVYYQLPLSYYCIRVALSSKLSPNIVQSPVALADDWMEYSPGKMFNVTGWGTLSDSYVR